MSTPLPEPRYAVRPDGVRLAYRHHPGDGPTIVFLPGFNSDMNGEKALALNGWAQANGRAFLRLDYSGCGASGGDFQQGTISTWLEDALTVVEAAAPGPLLLVGSSMGGWLMLLAAGRLGPDRVRGLVGIAPAPDFIDWGLLPSLTPEEAAALETRGRFERPSDYGGSIVFTRRLVEDGRANRLLGGPIDYAGPVRLLHGTADPDVPWVISTDVAERLSSSDVQVTLVKDGDHRLSTERNLALLCGTVAALLGETRCDR
jgi:pimeloyl-ACP methyl ester carboxylesterase